MAIFFRRFVGVLALDPATFEDIEHDRRSLMQSVVVVLSVCASAGIGALGLGLTGPAGFVAGSVLALGGWIVWVAIIAAAGTITFADRQTQSSTPELLRTLGFGMAPG